MILPRALEAEGALLHGLHTTKRSNERHVEGRANCGGQSKVGATLRPARDLRPVNAVHAPVVRGDAKSGYGRGVDKT
jgi:hypothetical protein